MEDKEEEEKEEKEGEKEEEEEEEECLTSQRWSQGFQSGEWLVWGLGRAPYPLPSMGFDGIPVGKFLKLKHRNFGEQYVQ